MVSHIILAVEPALYHYLRDWFWEERRQWFANYPKYQDNKNNQKELTHHALIPAYTIYHQKYKPPRHLPMHGINLMELCETYNLT